MTIFSFLSNYPKRFLSLFLTQIFFNFGFFGLKSLLILYLIHLNHLESKHIFTLFAALMSLCYSTSLLGGWIADKFIGPKATLFIGSILTILGMVSLMLPIKQSIYLGMSLVSIGSGCFKPNFSTLLSLLFKDPFDKRKDLAFTHLYVAMNIGSFLGPIVCGGAYQYFGWYPCLNLILLSFVIGSYVFFRYTPDVYKLLKNPYFHPFSASFVILVSIVLIYFLLNYDHLFDYFMIISMSLSLYGMIYIFYHANVIEKNNLFKILFYILLFTCFCALFEQAGGSFVLFIDQYVARAFWGYSFPSASLLALNPICILLFGKSISSSFSKAFEKNRTLNGFTKFSIGFFFISLSFILLFIACHLSVEKIDIVWIVLISLLQVIGEVFIIPVGFTAISKLSPPRHLSLVMGLWLMAIAYGHYLAGFFAQFYFMSGTYIKTLTLNQFEIFFLELGLFSLFLSLIILTVHLLKSKILFK